MNAQHSTSLIFVTMPFVHKYKYNSVHKGREKMSQLMEMNMSYDWLLCCLSFCLYVHWKAVVLVLSSRVVDTTVTYMFVVARSPGATVWAVIPVQKDWLVLALWPLRRVRVRCVVSGRYLRLTTLNSFLWKGHIPDGDVYN